MFGHQEEDEQANQAGSQSAVTPGTTLTAGTPTDASATAVDASEVDEALKALSATATPDEPIVTDAPMQDISGAPAPAVEPELPESVIPETVSPAVEPDASLTRAAAPAISESEHGDLLDLKQAALQQLTPLVDQLDQSPEEKFRTTMMMIQAADNQSLLQTAYDAAQQIEDEKVKAQALLDIVNEINYFTQQQPAEA